MATEQTPPASLDELDDDHHHDYDDHHSDDGDDTHGGSKTSAPIQKRRRVTRACDTCRGKKIKCDGKQPCTHCTVYSYDCTYDQPSNRRRNPAPQYIEALENRLARAEALLKTVMPNVDLNDPNLGNGMLPPLVQFPQQMPRKGGQDSEEDKNSMLQSMIERAGSIDLDADGRLDFYGSSSGKVFFERISRQMGTYDGNWNMALRNGSLDQNRSEQLLKESRRALDSPRSADSPGDIEGGANIQDLPNKDCGRALCECAIEDAMVLLRFLHTPTFWRMFDRIYDTHISHWTNEEHRYLPVIYAAMALGTLFGKSEDSKLGIEGYQSALDNGFKYFSAASSMLDLTDIRDLQSLQAALLMTYFIQSSAKLSTCYSYIGVCLFGALRMGMHRNCPKGFNPLEKEMRKRAFWLIRKMDVFIAGTLGMPILLGDDDIDQEYPTNVDDDLITAEGILPQPEGKISLIEAANVHGRLLQIWSKILRHIYPVRQPDQSSNSETPNSISVSYAKIREIEKELQGWMDNMPMAFRPGAGGDEKMIRLQHLLRMSYAHVQMVLYRPFLHYVAQQEPSKGVDSRFYACAAACVHVARNSIHIMSEMNRRHLLIGAYWFQMYTTFWAVLILVFYSVENNTDRSVHEYFNDAIDGKEMLATMAKRSAAADRCNSILEQVFSKLPERLRRGRQTSSSTDTRKRHAKSSTRNDVDVTSRNTARSFSNPFAVPQRATTMPQHQHSASGNHKRTSLSNIAYSQASHSNTDPYSRMSQNVYTPTSSIDQMTPQSGASPEVPSSPASAMNFGQAVNSTDASSGLNPAVHDLASMMFPSNDPFAYPNQPMTTFESQYGPSMDGLGTPFDMGSDLSQVKMEPNTFGDFLQGVQDSGVDSQPLGPSVPVDLMSRDWTPANLGSAGASSAAGPNDVLQCQTALPNDHGINYDSLFSGGDMGLTNMNGPVWFNDGLA